MKKWKPTVVMDEPAHKAWWIDPPACLASALNALPGLATRARACWFQVRMGANPNLIGTSSQPKALRSQPGGSESL